jgi:hypothetical protein
MTHDHKVIKLALKMLKYARNASERDTKLAKESLGRLFKRKDGKYFLYLPKDLVEDTNFPFPLNSSTRVRVCFTPGFRKIIIEEC